MAPSPGTKRRGAMQDHAELGGPRLRSDIRHLPPAPSPERRTPGLPRFLADFGPIRSPVSAEADRLFRLNLIAGFGVVEHPFR